MSNWVSALDLEQMKTKWFQKKDALDVRDMLEVIALAESLRSLLVSQAEKMRAYERLSEAVKKHHEPPCDDQGIYERDPIGHNPCSVCCALDATEGGERGE